MDIVVKGRNVEVPEHYRVHVAEKMSRVERYDHKAIRYEVELFHERNPRQSKSCQRVEITGKSRGPAVRAEACGPDFYGALDSAVGKLENRLRRIADRRKVHHGRRQPTSVAEATAPLASSLVPAELAADNGQSAPTRLLDRPENGADSDHAEEHGEDRAASFADYDVPAQRGESMDDGPGRIVREKEHSAAPMTVDQALYEMELVGHDFYLFADAASGCASVVYRRRGFDYGVIRLV
ncbi:MAG: ribosome-associated translation inhibitor RaiA [Pseudonocardiaceae bacterium]|nr:ribosome-associated translation inhibitor RaiA [Pseudonocardiaceae bacterium]